MAYVGCILFALVFLVISTQQTGSLQERMGQTVHWIHSWAPFSYLIILIVLVAPVVMMKMMNSWPKREEPEDPMAKYRRQAAEGLIEDPED
jgi:NADH:ubiquinone oxidoreductase subunit 6 (subunit J)